MAEKQVDNLKQMEIDLKYAIREYYLTDNKEAILNIQELATKMAILHGFASNAMIDADEYAIRLDAGFFFYWNFCFYTQYNSNKNKSQDKICPNIDKNVP